MKKLAINRLGDLKLLMSSELGVTNVKFYWDGEFKESVDFETDSMDIATSMALSFCKMSVY